MLARLFWGVVSSAVGMILCVGAWGQQLPATKCSTASVSGTYGAVLYGSTSSGDVLAYGGQVTFNGKGSFSGSWTTNFDNDITTVLVTGSYKVASGCTGIITMNAQGSPTLDFNLVVDSSQRLELIVTNAGLSVIGYALPQGQATCTAAGLAGTWAWNSNGLTAGFIASVALSAKGMISGLSTIVVNGDVESNLQTGGTFTIDSNCTGTISFTLNGQQQPTADFVVVNGGKQILVTDALGLITALR